MPVKRDNLPAEEASEFLKNFANPTRLRLLCALSGAELSVGALAESAGVTMVSTSQQLAILRREGIVVARRARQIMYYRLADKNVSRFIEVLASSFCPTKAQGGACDPDPSAEERF